MNAVMKEHLCVKVNYIQHNWSSYLFLAEFTGNNQVSDLTILFPIFANAGYHPHCDFELDIRINDPEEY